jgi:hypothetical protein
VSSVQQLGTCGQCGVTKGLPGDLRAVDEPISLVAAALPCSECEGELSVPPGLYRTEGERLVLVRPLSVNEIIADVPDAERIASVCDRCGAVRGVPDTPTMVILQDRPLPIHHNQWAILCHQCGGSFRIPAAVYDKDSQGRLTFVRPLRTTDSEAGTPTSFTMAFVPRGDRQALEAALRTLKREDLTADQAADVVESVAPELSWASAWLRARRDEFSRNQLSIVIAIICFLLTLYAMGRPVQLSDDQMDQLVERVGTPASVQPSEEEINTAVQRCLDEAEGQPRN